jgi:Phage gp6-like head-tail connector protein
MQQILNVITASPTVDLVSLDDMKKKLQIPAADTSKDFLLQEIITNASDTIARMCNRVFGRELVEETFYQLEDETTPSTQRLYLSRWPVASVDIESMTCDDVDILPDSGQPISGEWVLEQLTGTLYRPRNMGAWGGVIDVTYTGGYDLPDGAPASLKFAVEAIIREGYSAWSRNPASFGVRQISHKESRVGYFAPNMFPTLGIPATWTQVGGVLHKYMRHWI